MTLADLIPVIGWPLLIAYILRAWRVERREQRAETEWADLMLTVEQAHADIDTHRVMTATTWTTTPLGLHIRHDAVYLTDLDRLPVTNDRSTL